MLVTTNMPVVVHSSIHLFTQQRFTRASSAAGTAVGSGDTAVNKTAETPALMVRGRRTMENIAITQSESGSRKKKQKRGLESLEGGLTH